jgi:hypothetical protein
MHPSPGDSFPWRSPTNPKSHSNSNSHPLTNPHLSFTSVLLLIDNISYYKIYFEPVIQKQVSWVSCNTPFDRSFGGRVCEGFAVGVKVERDGAGVGFVLCG